MAVADEGKLFRYISQKKYDRVVQMLGRLRVTYPGLRDDTLLIYALCLTKLPILPQRGGQ